MTKVIIAGGRDFNNYELLKEKCDKILSSIDDRIMIVSGCSLGADSLGERYANEREYLLAYYPVNWRLYGAGGGPVRNREMVDYADALIAFWDEKSKGTAHTIRLAEKKGIPTRVIKY